MLYYEALWDFIEAQVRAGGGSFKERVFIHLSLLGRIYKTFFFPVYSRDFRDIDCICLRFHFHIKHLHCRLLPINCLFIILVFSPHPIQIANRSRLTTWRQEFASGKLDAASSRAEACCLSAPNAAWKEQHFFRELTWCIFMTIMRLSVHMVVLKESDRLCFRWYFCPAMVPFLSREIL